MVIADAHNDFYTSREIGRYKIRGKDVVNYAVWGTELSEYEIATIGKKIKNDGQILSFEDVSNIKNPELVLELKPIWCSLTWNHDNSLGGGCYGQNIGLTKLGKLWCKLLRGDGVLVDTAHSSERTFYDVIRFSKPVVNSHSCAYSVQKDKRNLRDGQILEIARSGGFMGLCLHSPFLNGKNIARIDDVIRHVDHIFGKFGTTFLGLGTDFYGSKMLPFELNSYEKIEILAEKLQKSGYNSEDINSLIYNNFVNFLDKNFQKFAY